MPGSEQELRLIVSYGNRAPVICHMQVRRLSLRALVFVIWISIL
jgi:hypothetical protein